MSMNSDQDMQTTGHESGPRSLQMEHPLRRLAYMESIVGQVFLAVFMARLLGVHISQEGSGRLDRFPESGRDVSPAP